MDGDVEIIPPLGDVAIPYVHSDPAQVLQALVCRVSEIPDSRIDFYAGCAGNPAEDRRFVPLVTLDYGDRRWLLSVPCARQLGFRLGVERTLAWVLGDLVALATLIFDTADQAEALAAADNPLSLVEKQS